MRSEFSKNSQIIFAVYDHIFLWFTLVWINMYSSYTGVYIYIFISTFHSFFFFFFEL